MPINSSIAMGVQPMKIDGPADQYGKMLTLQNLLQQSQQGEMQMQDAQEARQGKRTLNDLLRSNTDAAGKTNEAGLYSGLAQAGQGSQIAAMRKQFADTNKAQADYSKTIGEVQKAKIGQYRDALTNVNSPEVAAQWLQAQYADPDLKAHMTSMAPLEQALSNIPKDPVKLAQWVQQNALGMTKFTELNKPTIHTQNLGGVSQVSSVPGFGGAPTVLSSTPITQSADSAASVAQSERVSLRADARARETTAATISKPFEATGPEGVPVLVRQDKAGNITPVQGFSPKSGSAKLTEDQGKATGWLVQAENAFANMKASGFDDKGGAKSAAYPGVNDAIAKVPGLAPLANSMRTADRQKFIQASSSLSEALLRAATGAGVNESEARQKIQELTPQFGEDATATKLKMDSIPLYLEALKVRAGPGAKQAAQVLNNKPGAGPTKTQSGATASNW